MILDSERLRDLLQEIAFALRLPTQRLRPRLARIPNFPDRRQELLPASKTGHGVRNVIHHVRLVFCQDLRNGRRVNLRVSGFTAPEATDQKNRPVHRVRSSREVFLDLLLRRLGRNYRPEVFQHV